MQLYINILKQYKQYRRIQIYRTWNIKYALTTLPQILIPNTQKKPLLTSFVFILLINLFLCTDLHTNRKKLFLIYKLHHAIMFATYFLHLITSWRAFRISKKIPTPSSFKQLYYITKHFYCVPPEMNCFQLLVLKYSVEVKVVVLVI